MHDSYVTQNALSALLNQNDVGELRQAIERLLVCPITQIQLVDPHVVEIDIDGQKQVLTISGETLRNFPNEFQANLVGLREITYQGSSYRVRPCFDRIVSDLLGLINKGIETEYKNNLEAILTCPITHELFVDPIITSTGCTYSQNAWSRWERRNGMFDMQRSPVSFIYASALAAELVSVYDSYYPKQQSETALETVARKDSSVSLAACLGAGACFSMGEAGVVMFLGWCFGGCNSKALALKLAVGGGTGCCIGMIGAVMYYLCCASARDLRRHCNELSQCRDSFYTSCCCITRDDAVRQNDAYRV